MAEKPDVFKKTKKLSGDTEFLDSNNENFLAEKKAAVEEIYNSTSGNMDYYTNMMKERTFNQMKEKEAVGVVHQSTIIDAEVKDRIDTSREISEKYTKSDVNEEPFNTITKIDIPDEKLLGISQPQYNTQYDILPLPSEGKVYKHKKDSIRVGYLTTIDEDILTSPNILQSGKFLSILLNRKILEPNIRYDDLHLGDRNAILIWLRSTSYGEMYPITILDERGEPFDTEVDLTTLKIKKLGAEPDENGYFDFVMPLSKSKVKFKLLTCKDIDLIEEKLTKDAENNELINKETTYTLMQSIVEVDGQKNRGFIEDFVNSIRVRDSKELKKYIDKVESGIDLNIEVKTPRGGSVKTFLPLNFKFFWPEF